MNMKLKVIEEHPWYADGLSFSCTGCGNCCSGGPGYVWLTTIEIGRLAAHLALEPREVIERYCRRHGSRYSLKEMGNPRGEYDCIFLKEIPAPPAADRQQAGAGRRICTIYPVRPLQCRTWPFWDGPLASPAAWKRASARCPGMNQGRRYTHGEIQSLLSATDWPEPSAKD
jgi:uncharacterized protein